MGKIKVIYLALALLLVCALQWQTNRFVNINASEYIFQKKIYHLGQTGSGVGSYSFITQPIYFSVVDGDKIIMQVTNKSGSNTATVKFGSFFVYYIHD